MTAQIVSHPCPRWYRLLFRTFTLFCALWPLFLQVPSVSAQTSPVPYGPYGPSFHLRSYSYVYPKSYPSIHDVDFGNLKVTFGNDENARPVLTQLKNGGWKVDGPVGSYNSICLEGVHFLGSAEPGREYALAVFFEDDMGANSTSYGLAEIFELADKHLRVTQLVDWDLNYGGPFGRLDDFDEIASTLKIHSSHYQAVDFPKRPSAIDFVTFHWNGRAFSQTAIHTELSEYGREKH